MKLSFRNISAAVVASVILAGCAASRQAEKSLTITPSPYSVIPDSTGTVAVCVDIDVPARYMGNRTRLILLPRLVKDSVMVASLDSVAVDARIYTAKLERKQKLEDYEDPYTGTVLYLKKRTDTLVIPYRDTVVLPADSADLSRLTLVVTTDGCGECSAVDTVDFGGVSDLLSLMNVAYRTRWIEPTFVIKDKFREGHGEAELMFAINSSDIDMRMGKNSKEMHRMLDTIQSVLSDSLSVLTSVKIQGGASADGLFLANSRLAQGRAGSARTWLLANLKGLTSEQRRSFSTGFRPEGWEPVLDAMRAASDPDTAAVKAILEKYADEDDDYQERYIRALPCWNRIKTYYLSSTRKVEFTFHYSIRSFTTDEELLELYRTRPDAFNEEEMLRVTQLTDSSSMVDVYRTVLEYFPESFTAANNLAIMLLGRGDSLGAAGVLQPRTAADSVTLNTKAVTEACIGEREEAIKHFIQCGELPEARYNLGLLMARERNYAMADHLLRPFADINAAIVCVCRNDFAAADSIMRVSGDMSPKAEYVRTVIAAGMDDSEAFFTHLQAAVADRGLYERAKSDVLLDRYRYDDRFAVIMKGRE